MSTIENIRARFSWATTTGSDSAPIEPLTPSDVRTLRLPWLSRFTPERMAAQIAAHPDLALWTPQTGEYVLAEAWRNRDDVAQLVEATTRRGQARLVSAVVERAREWGYRQVVLGDEVMNANRKLYSGLGFAHLERVIILRRPLKHADNLPDISGVPAVEMRRAVYADVAALVRVDNDSFPWLWWNSRREFEAYIDMPGVHIYLAYLDGEPAGYTSFTLYDDWAHLDRIAVAPGSQGRGLGAAQLAYVLRLMKATGAAHVALSTQLSNTQSHKLYDRFNFTRTADHMDFYGLKL